MTTFGATLRDCCRSAGLSQVNLARRLGVTATYVSRIIGGLTIPTDDRIRQAADIMGVDPDPLLDAAWQSRGTLTLAYPKSPLARRLLLAMAESPGMTDAEFAGLLRAAVDEALIPDLDVALRMPRGPVQTIKAKARRVPAGAGFVGPSPADLAHPDLDDEDVSEIA